MLKNLYSVYRRYRRQGITALKPPSLKWFKLKVFKEYYKGHQVSYCDLCEVKILVCPSCKNTTCNGGGCDFCLEEFKDFEV